MDNNSKQSGQSAPLKKLLTEDEVADLLQVSPRHIGYLRSRKQLPFVKLGRVVRFDPDQLALAVARHTVSARA